MISNLSQPVQTDRTLLDDARDAEVIAKGAGVNLLASAAKSIKMVTVVFIIWLFGPETFGLYLLGWSVIDIISRFSMFGLEKGVIQFTIRHRIDNNTAGEQQTLGQAIVLGMLISAVVMSATYLVAPLIALQVFKEPELVPFIRLLAYSIPFIVLTHVLLAATKSLKKMQYEAYAKSAEPLIYFAGAAVTFIAGWRLNGLALAQIGATAGSAVLAVMYFSRFFSLSACMRRIWTTSQWKALARFALPVVCYDMLYILLLRLDALLIGYFLSATQVGIYGVAIEIAFLAKKIRQWFDPIFAPFISELHHQNNMARLADNFALVTRWILTLNIGFFVVIVVIGQDLLHTLDPTYTQGLSSLILLCLSQIIYGSMGTGDLMLMMSGYPYLNLMNTLIVLIMSFGMGVYLIPHYGIVGAAVATLTAFVLLTVIRLVQIDRLLGLSPLRKNLIKPFVAGGGACLIALTVQALMPVPHIPGLILYTLIVLALYLFLLRWLGVEERDRGVFQSVRIWLSARWTRYRTPAIDP